jgi:hypothetical protein
LPTAINVIEKDAYNVNPTILVKHAQTVNMDLYMMVTQKYVAQNACKVNITIVHVKIAQIQLNIATHVYSKAPTQPLIVITVSQVMSSTSKK